VEITPGRLSTLELRWVTVLPRGASTAFRAGAGALLAVSAASLGAGGGLYGSAAHDLDKLKAQCVGGALFCSPQTWADTEKRANASYALFAIGGAAMAIDIVLWAVHARALREVPRPPPSPPQ
jgi:hypothetical protein